jgi:hypothetical protein
MRILYAIGIPLSRTIEATLTGFESALATGKPPRFDRKPCCFWLFFDDELNLRPAEKAGQRAKLAKNSKTFLCWYREGAQAIGACDHVIFSIARHPDRRSVLFIAGRGGASRSKSATFACSSSKLNGLARKHLRSRRAVR